MDLTEEQIDALYEQVGESRGRLPDNSGWVFRGEKLSDYRRLLPQGIQDRLNADIVGTEAAQKLEAYMSSQKFIFIGDTTQVRDFYTSQLNDPNLTANQEFAKKWTLGWGLHDAIKREWFETTVDGVKINPQQLVDGQPSTGLAQYRILDTHLTDIYVDETQGFFFWHNKEAPNALLSGLSHHIFVELPEFFLKELSGNNEDDNT